MNEKNNFMFHLKLRLITYIPINVVLIKSCGGLFLINSLASGAWHSARSAAYPLMERIRYASCTFRDSLPQDLSRNTLIPIELPHKSEIRQSTIYYAGLLGWWNKWIVDQESDVPSTIFFILFIDLGHSKLFILIFVIWKKNR